MLPASLDAGSKILLTSPTETQAVRTVRSKKIIAVLFIAVFHVLRAVRVWYKRASCRDALDRLDDHILRDIGLTRADVQRELMKPFWRE